MAGTPYVKDEPNTATSIYGLAVDTLCKRLYDFETGKHDLRYGHELALKTDIAAALVDPMSVAYVVGHASRLGDATSNLALSERRASAVKKFLDKLVVNPTRIMANYVGKTATLGKDENDPIDRAVVIIVQSVKVPTPKFLKELPKSPPNPVVDGPWRIKSISGVTGAVPMGVGSIGVGAHILTLENARAKKTASYNVLGLHVGVGVDPKNIPILGPILIKLLKGFGGSYGPSSATTWGSEIMMRPFFKTPVLADDFAGAVTITSLSAGFGTAMSGGVIIFSSMPLTAPWYWPTIKAVGIYGSPAFAAGLGAETLHGKASLAWVL